MDAHRIKVFDRADDDAVILAVAHDFHLYFFPAQDRLLDQHLMRGGSLKPRRGDGFKIFLIVGDAATGTAQCKGGPDDERKGQLGGDAAYVVQGMGDIAFRNGKPDTFHSCPEQLTTFGFFDDGGICTDEFHSAFFEYPHPGKLQGSVQRGLTAKGRQYGVRSFLTNDSRHGVWFYRFHIRPVSQFRVCHDGGGVGIHKDDFTALFF